MADRKMEVIEEPRAARWLLASPAAAWIWLVARLWLGYEWLHAGVSKIWGAESAGFWGGGQALKGFATNAIASSHGPHASVSYGWWVQFLHGFVLPNSGWVAKVVAVGEFTVGAALILGMFTGLAALAGLALNFTYVFSGAVSTNPVFILVGAALLLAWRNAGWLGADRYLLPALGTPWHRGRVLQAVRERSPRTFHIGHA